MVISYFPYRPIRQSLTPVKHITEFYPQQTSNNVGKRHISYTTEILTANTNVTEIQ
jgi:hypothetical protein